VYALSTLVVIVLLGTVGRRITMLAARCGT
jgi:hypothetical protein